MTRLIAPIALIVFSTMLYQASASNAPSDAQAEAAGVQALVPANCRPENPSTRIYDLVGIDTRVAGGIMLRNPELLRDVCAIVNRSLMQVSLRELSRNRSMKDVGKEHADNKDLLGLATMLNMSPEEGQALVRAHGRQILKEKEAPTSAQKVSVDAILADNRGKQETYTLPSPPIAASSNGTGLVSGSASSIGLHYVPSSNFGLN